MLGFLVRRLALTLLTIWLAATIAFVALRLIPGDAIEAQLMPRGATPSEIAAQRTAFGLDQPVIVQYLAMLSGLLRGDLGRSLTANRPVSTILGEQLGATVQLAVSALVIATALGIGLGMGTAFGRSLVVRTLASGVTSLALAAPVYWTGTLAIYVFSVWLRWLPSSGGGDWRHLILPAATLGFAVSGGIARVTATTVRETQATDFIRTAHAKGLRTNTITRRHVLRASLAPIVTVIALQGGFLLGGAAITEALFVRQGIGQVVLIAISAHDYPVVQGAVVLGAIAYSVLNATADLIGAALNPRVRAPTV